jgi:hypothetical protein
MKHNGYVNFGRIVRMKKNGLAGETWGEGKGKDIPGLGNK